MTALREARLRAGLGAMLALCTFLSLGTLGPLHAIQHEAEQACSTSHCDDEGSPDTLLVGASPSDATKVHSHENCLVCYLVSHGTGAPPVTPPSLTPPTARLLTQDQDAGPSWESCLLTARMPRAPPSA